MSSILHLIADPLCGWCFGATPLLKASQDVTDLPIKLHLGGLFSTPNNKVVDAAMIQFIMSHHERITQLTEQSPGTALTELLNSGNAVLDSTPPIKACLTASLAGGNDLNYYQALIKAHFIDGLRIVEEETLNQIAVECGINAEEFKQAYENLSVEQVAQHINDSRILLQRVGGQGFPTFALEQNNQIKILNHQTLYNNPTGWQQSLKDMLSSQLTH
ncbi:MAG: DsbA family protein [Gammaproteobacteria bacterium]|jgi:putative protein-disulfide isomerase|nr:DsbA family protein [Gammaproteobacteria bacterium]